MSNSAGFKLAAQRKKAMALVGAIDSIALKKGVNPFDDALHIALLIDNEWKGNEPVWEALARRASVNLPSSETRAIVRGIYADRVRAPLQPVVMQ